MPKKEIAKYRPFLDSEQILLLSELLSKAVTNDPMNAELLKLHSYLLTFSFKAKNNLVSYTSITQKETLEESLGFSPSPSFPSSSSSSSEFSLGNVTQDMLDQFNSGSHSFTAIQISTIMEYKYLNSLMTPEEEARYEEKYL